MDQRREVKPKNMGGTLIRRVVAGSRHVLQKSANVGSHIHIATSAGPDSTALALLLARYGRRLVDRSQISLLYVHHHWREKEGEEESAFVEGLAKKLGVGFERGDLEASEVAPKGRSKEEAARTGRKRIYRELLAQKPGLVVTGHHSDDLVETLLWRIFEGTLARHLDGIEPLVEISGDGYEWRPLLTSSKIELKEFLKEERQEWRVDFSNEDGLLMRSKLRALLVPALDLVFSGWRKGILEHVELLRKLKKSENPGSSEELDDVVAALFTAAHLQPRRTHWRQIKEKIARLHWDGELELGAGWKLTQKKVVPKDATQWKLWRQNDGDKK